MIEVLLHWILALLLIWPTGTMLRKRMGIPTAVPQLFALLIGFCALMCSATAMALFFPLQPIVGLIYLAVNLGLLYVYRNEIPAFSLVKKTVKLWWWPCLWLLFCAFISALPPGILDAYSYYFPTIDWLQAGGWVRGLGNVHFFWALGSPWHAAEAMLTAFTHAQGLYWGGFWLAILGIYTAHSRQAPAIWMRYFGLLGLPIWIYLSASSSPDIGAWLFVGWAAAIGLSADPKRGVEAMWWLGAAACIKPIYAPVALLFGLGMTLYYRHTFGRFIGHWAIAALTMGIITVVKNIRLSGYPLFPLAWGASGMPQQIPEKIRAYLMQPALRHDGRPLWDGHVASVFHWLQHWWQLSPVECGASLVTFLLVLLMILRLGLRLWAKSRWEGSLPKMYWLLGAVHLCLMAISSWQCRFYLIVPWLLLTHVWTQYKVQFKTLSSLMMGAMLLVALGGAVFIYASRQEVMPNTLHIMARTWWACPPSHTKAYPHHIGHFNYFSPPTTAPFWYAGRGPLPMVSHRQIEFFDQMGFRPQPFGPSPMQGFYTQTHASANHP